MGCGTGSGGGCDTCEVSEKRGSPSSSVFNWLANIDEPQNNLYSKLVEVQFKRNRKDYFENKEDLNIVEGDFVAVETKSGHDIGKITLIGEIVHYQLKRKKIDTEKNPLKKLYRVANDRDISKFKSSIDLEDPTFKKAKRIIKDHKLNMKLIDVEFQSDGSKAVFYYTAERRVDFRELIREYSKTFKVKIEMKQIGVRQESARVGGIGSCGRELCCSTWMTKFPTVSTSSVRYQQLSINPQKISGQCGKLKCCLNFELESYLDCLKDFPNQKTILKTKEGELKQIKIDVFKKRIWYINKSTYNETFEISINQANRIIKKNESGDKNISLDKYLYTNTEKRVTNDLTEDNINRFDKKKKRK